MPRPPRFIEIPEVKIARETEKALLCVIKDETEVWVPKSVVDETSEVQLYGDEGTLVVQRWFVEKTDELEGYLDDA